MSAESEMPYVFEADDEERRAEIQAQIDVLKFVGGAAITLLISAATVLFRHFI